MTHRERFLATVRGEPADRIPVYHLQFSGQSASVILGRGNVCVGGEHNQWLEINALWEGEEAHREFDAKCERDAVAVAEACGHDMLRLRYWRWRSDQKPVKKIDDSTFLFGDPDGEWYTLTYDPAIELMTRKVGRGNEVRSATRRPPEPELSEDALRREVEEMEARSAEYAPPAGPNQWLANKIAEYPDYLVRHGGGTVYVDMHTQRELLSAALWPELYRRKILAWAERIVKDVPAMAEAGLELNLAGMDICSQKGPSISPEMFRDIVAPGMKLIVDACHERGMYYFFTSDGNFWPLADIFFEEVGVDGWCETDASAGMDLRELRERFPSTTFIGNIRSQVLHRGSRDDVVREAEDCLAAAHDLGGIVVGVSNLIMPGTPAENIHALLETIERNR